MDAMSPLRTILRRAGRGPVATVLATLMAVPVASAPSAGAAPPGRDVDATGDGVCGPKRGSCFAGRETPGCNWAPCCRTVCDLFPECCESMWDDLCVEAAEILCGDAPPLCELAFGACDRGRTTVGCGDEGCCSLVCSLDPWCCSSQWDDVCASIALRYCDASPPAPVDAAVTRLEEEPCGERLNDGCNVEPAVFAAIARGDVVAGTTWTRTIRDTDWFEIEIVDGEAAPVVTIAGGFPVSVTAMRGDCGTEWEVSSWRLLADAGTANERVLDLEPGTWWLVVAPELPTEGPLRRALACPVVDPEEGAGRRPSGLPRYFDRRYVLAVR